MQSILQRVTTLSLFHKVTLFFLMGSILLITIMLTWWFLSPTYAVLFNHLEEHDAQHVLSQLDQEGISYHLRHGGSDILIDKNLIDKTRLKIMSNNQQFSGSVGFELFDKSDFGMTDFSQKINYQRALQGELERTITSLDEIHHARVHIIIPETHLFAKDNHHPKAAITLHLKQSLTSKQVQSIQHLVSASVEHLRIKNVVVMDQNGNMLSTRDDEGALMQFKAKKDIEQYLNTKVTLMLQTIFPKNQALVTIDATINYDELQKELVKPQSLGSISHEKEMNHSVQSKTDKDKTNQDITFEKSYTLGSEKELFKRANGTIERLTISVVLPKNTDKELIAQIERVVKSTVGFNAQRGDVVSVEALIALQVSESLSSEDILPNLTEEANCLVDGVPQSACTDRHAPVLPRTLLSSASLKKGLANLIPEKVISNLDKTAFYYAFLILFFLTSVGLIIRKKMRHKKRQLLLSELKVWLEQYE